MVVGYLRAWDGTRNVVWRNIRGRTFDVALLNDLPATVDPCGERGEFHTFAFVGPMFSEAIEFDLGEIVERDGFYYVDLCTVSASA